MLDMPGQEWRGMLMKLYIHHPTGRSGSANFVYCGSFVIFPHFLRCFFLPLCSDFTLLRVFPSIVTSPGGESNWKLAHYPCRRSSLHPPLPCSRFLQALRAILPPTSPCFDITTSHVLWNQISSCIDVEKSTRDNLRTEVVPPL